MIAYFWVINSKKNSSRPPPVFFFGGGEVGGLVPKCTIYIPVLVLISKSMVRKQKYRHQKLQCTHGQQVGNIYFHP